VRATSTTSRALGLLRGPGTTDSPASAVGPALRTVISPIPHETHRQRTGLAPKGRPRRVDQRSSGPGTARPPIPPETHRERRCLTPECGYRGSPPRRAPARPAHPAPGTTKGPDPKVRPLCQEAEAYLMIFVTVPAPTVRPPSRMAKPRPSSMAIGWISSTVTSVVSPGMTISVPSGSVMTPVTSVVRK